MKKLLYITNIPTPYRQKRFNTMAEIFPQYGIDFEVLYMAKIEPDRQWIIPKNSYNYKFKIYKGIHPTIAGLYAHFNPGLLMRLMKNNYDIVVVGGMASPTHWLSHFFIPKNKLKIMSVESNLHSVKRTKGVGARIKKILLEKADAYQVTGSPQKDYVNYFLSSAINKPYIFFPNIIDGDLFIKQVDILKEKKEILREELNVLPNEQMWVLPSRLIKIKGIVPFIRSIIGLKGYKLFILGDGELRNEIETLINLNSMPIKIVGFIQQDEVLEYYSAADLFILPSYEDPSPLSPIEGSASSLPLLVSKNIGNINEILTNNNGWKFEPGNEKEINSIVKKILNLSRDDLKIIGENSRKRYQNIFDTESCIRNYAQQIIEICKND